MAAQSLNVAGSIFPCGCSPWVSRFLPLSAMGAALLQPRGCSALSTAAEGCWLVSREIRAIAYSREIRAIAYGRTHGAKVGAGSLRSCLSAQGWMRAREWISHG